VLQKAKIVVRGVWSGERGGGGKEKKGGFHCEKGRGAHGDSERRDENPWRRCLIASNARGQSLGQEEGELRRRLGRGINTLPPGEKGERNGAEKNSGVLKASNVYEHTRAKKRVK